VVAQQQQEQVPSDSLRSRVEEGELAGVASPVGFRADEAIPTRVSSPAKDAWRRFRQNWAAMISLITILLLIFAAIFAPLLHTLDPLNQSYDILDLGPNPHHWFGTDGLGRDQYSRMLYGLRTPLIVGVVGTAITVFLGMLIGVISGYFGGFIDSLLARFTDMMFAFPAFTLALIIVSFYGNALDPIFAGVGRLMVLVIVFSIVGWPALMRFVRSLTLSMKEQQFIDAAKTSGTGSWKMMTRHLLPNMYGLILVQASFVVVGFIYTEAVLSIFGLGVEAPNPDLGAMLYEGSQRLGLNYWEAMFPSVFLTVIILSFTFFGDGVRDAVDPRSSH